MSLSPSNFVLSLSSASLQHNEACAEERDTPGFILETGQLGSNGPPSVILGGSFSRKGVLQKVFELVGTDCSMRK